MPKLIQKQNKTFLRRYIQFQPNKRQHSSPGAGSMVQKGDILCSIVWQQNPENYQFINLINTLSPAKRSRILSYRCELRPSIYFFISSRFLCFYFIDSSPLIHITSLAQYNNLVNTKMIYFYCPSLLSFNSQSFQPLLDPLECSSSNKNDQTSIEQRNIFSPTILLCSSSQEQLPTMEVLPKIKNQKVFANDEKQTKDGEYTPESQCAKRKKTSKQLQNRNVVPNIVRLILSFVQKKGKSERIVELLLKQNKCAYATLQRFFNFHKLIKNSMNNYVHQETLAKLVSTYPEHLFVYTLEEQICYNQITRKLILHFLRNEAELCVVTSKRMDKIKKRDHLSAIKLMNAKLKSILSQPSLQ